MTNLRILFVSGEYPPMQGGVADYTHEISRALVELGCDIGILCSIAAADAPLEPGITVWPLVERWGWHSWSDLDRIVSEWRPDVVHIQYQTAAFGMHPAINLWPWRPWQRAQVVTAVTFHDLLEPYLFPKAHLIRRWITRTLATHCTIAITTNPEDTTRLRSIRPDLVEIPIGSNIPNAPPIDFDRQVYRQRLGLNPDTPLISYFGFLNASKGGEILVDVLAKLVEHGCDAHLLMIGGRVGASDPTNYAYWQQVEERITQFDLDSRVHWTDHVPAPEVSAAFIASDLCLLPYQDGASYRRGSFLAALEHGVPIVTTAPAILYPDLHHGKTVLLAPAGDTTVLTHAVERILSDADLRDRLKVNAVALAERFRWEQIALTSLDAYRAFMDA